MPKKEPYLRQGLGCLMKLSRKINYPTHNIRNESLPELGQILFVDFHCINDLQSSARLQPSHADAR